jgi:hypothetical protein
MFASHLAFRSWNLRRMLPVGAAVAVALAAAAAPVASASAATAHHTHSAHRTPAPVLRVSGTTLKWNTIHKIRSYKLATIRNPATTRNTTYRVVKGTSFKPKSAGGQTIKYGLEANVANAPWSTEVTITTRKTKKSTRAAAAAAPAPSLLPRRRRPGPSR